METTTAVITMMGAAHEVRRVRSSGVMRKFAVGHFLPNLRNHSISHLAMADQRGTRKGDQDMYAFERSEIQDLRMGEPMGAQSAPRPRGPARDKAGIDFLFWQKAKKDRRVLLHLP